MSRYNSRHYSRSRLSDWSGFSLRFLGALVVFAIAALSGAVIGGVSIYLINDAATPPPSAIASSNSTSAPADSATTPSPARQQEFGATSGRPVRMIDPAFPPPAPTAGRNNPPAPAEATARPPAGEPASPAAIPAPPAASQPPAAMQPQSAPASAAASQAPEQDNLQTTAHDAATRDTATQAAAPETGDHTSAPRKTAVTRKRTTVTNARQAGPQPGLQASDQAQSVTHRSFYDYYDRDDDRQRASATDLRARRGSGQTQQRLIVHRQDNYDRDDQADRRSGFPAQPRPAQSFFGFFGDHNDRN